MIFWPRNRKISRSRARPLFHPQRRRFHQVTRQRDTVAGPWDTESAELRAMVHTLGLQVAELQRRLGSGSDDSGTPSSKESIEAKARRKAERQARQEQQNQE